MADTRVFSYKPSQLTDLASTLHGHGISVDLSKAGEANSGGWDISWSFPSLTEVSITVNKHPFAEEGFFWSKINSVFNSVQN